MSFLQALRIPTFVFLGLAVLVIVISILLVWRHLYRTWRNVIPEEADAADNMAAQQDKELSLIESQLHRSTPIVVLQPDSKVHLYTQQGPYQWFSEQISPTRHLQLQHSVQELPASAYASFRTCVVWHHTTMQ